MAAVHYDWTLQDQDVVLNPRYVHTLHKRIDFSDSDFTLADTDTAKVLNIPINCMVLHEIADVRVQEGAETLDVGYTGAATYFHDDLNLNVVAATQSAGLPLLFTAANHLLITAGSALAVGTVDFWLILIRTEFP